MTTPEMIEALRGQLAQGAAVVAARRAQSAAAREAIARAHAEPSTIVVGARAEDGAAELLVSRGYRIVERNFRVKLGELDIVAVDGDTLVFVEVRSRADDRHGSAIEAVGYRKQRQVSRVASMYIAMRRPTQKRMRFDVVAITAGRPVLIRDAWRLGLAR